MEELRRSVSDLTSRVARVEARQEAHDTHCAGTFREMERRMDDESASRIWVRDAVDSAVKPLAETVQKLGTQIGEVVSLQRNTEKRVEEFHATQNAMMRERNEREKTESEARLKAMEAASWKNVFRKWWFWLLGAIAFGPDFVEFLKSLSDLGITPK